MDRIKRPFINLPYRKRRDAFIRWRWRILLDTPIYGGLFTSQLRLDEQDYSSDWFDFLFVGSDGQTVWNAFIITARAAFLDADRFELPINTEIHECFKINRNFPNEVGLDIVVDEPFIDRKVIENAILHFRTLGEVDWTNPIPVPKDHLLAGSGVQLGNASLGKVGIFWFVQWQGCIRLLSASCPIAEGELYGDMITYGTGHYTTWNRWRKSKVAPFERGIANAFEYEEWPRGRVSYCQNTRRFLLLCDGKIMREDLLSRIRGAFELPEEQVTVDGDPHYQSVENFA